MRPWIQHAEEISESACSSKSGIWRAFNQREGGKCYYYDVIKEVCLVIGFASNLETNSYTWEYECGCFQDGEIAMYERAEPGDVFKFEHVPVAVREDDNIFE